MQSDPRIPIALRSVAGFTSAYRSGVISSLERVRAMLTADGGAARARRELGAFAAARIDADRFAELSRGSALDAPSRARIARCADVLREFANVPDEGFTVDVPAWRRPYPVVSSVLARFGRAFGAAIAADLARSGAYDPQQHDCLTEEWGYDRWTKAERRVAPPIVLSVLGSDLRVAEFAELLDGTQHIVFVVRGPCAPAPLVRLFTPDTLVLQTTDVTGLDRFSAYNGPAIAALMPDESASFLHDPERGAASWQRLQIWRRPAAEPRRSVGGLSPRQQREELLQLEALSTQPALPTAPIDALVPHGAGNASDRLADWLLAQSGLSENR
jgi:hypothetical protein